MTRSRAELMTRIFPRLDVLVGRSTRSDRATPVGAWTPVRPTPGEGGDPRPGGRLRRVPHRPAHRRRGARGPSSSMSFPATRSSAMSTASARTLVRFVAGERVGIAWLRSTCGTCRFCATGRENLCLTPRFTGWDDDGGYAEYAVVPEAYAYRLPEQFDDVAAAPLLCAGIIGFRALERALVPDGGRLGIYGFGGSAHLAAQLAIHRGATVHVLTRSASARALALELGCASAGRATDEPPEPLDAAILFAPAGELVRVALRALDRGGTLAIAGIHLSDIPPIDYTERAVPGTPGPQRHRQHPARRRALPARGSRRRRARPHRRVPVRGRRSGRARPLERRRRRRRGAGARALRLNPPFCLLQSAARAV